MIRIDAITKKIEKLEERTNPEVNTWMDLMVAVSEGREIVLGKSMAGLFEGLDDRTQRGRPPAPCPL